MFTYMGQNHVEMSSTTMFPPAAFIGEHQQQEQLFMEMETTTRAQEIKKKSTCCSSSINTIVAAAAEVLNPNSSSVVGAGSDSCNTKKPKTPRKRSGKKDRHSKIVTAQGTRGRRMRLSLDIARRFFSLQDMLGFDKASKTVGWLLSKSKHAIKDLCLPDLPDDNYEDEDESKSLEGMMATKRAKKKKKFTVGTCKVMTSPMNQGQGLVVDREELRVMARARARERTLDKLKVPKSNQFTNNKGSSHSMGSASSFETEYEQCPGSTNQINKSADQEDNNSIPANFTQNWAIDHVTTIPFPSSTYGAVMHQHLSTTAGDIHEQAVPRSIFTTSSDLRLQSHFSDSQLYGKLWEHYYTYSNLR